MYIYNDADLSWQNGLIWGKQILCTESATVEERKTSILGFNNTVEPGN